MQLVLDCSLAMAWCFEDESDALSDAALAALYGGDAVVPGLWPLEVSNVLVIAERQKRIDEADTLRFLHMLGNLPITVEQSVSGRMMDAALALARSQTLSAYDAAYLELAMRTGRTMATRDGGLRQACERVGVELLGD